MTKGHVLICPRCGKTNDKIEFVDAFCVECYLGNIKIKVPDSVSFEQCGRCNRIRFRGEWIPFSEKKIGNFVIDRCRGQFKDATYDVYKQIATFTVGDETSKKTTTLQLNIPLELNKTICQQCSQISGGYFEGIIQLRGDKREKLESMADKIIKRLEGKTFVSKIDEKDEGLDIYVGKSKVVVKLMSDLGMKKVLMTKKLVGREQGTRLYRTTFLVRL